MEGRSAHANIGWRPWRRLAMACAPARAGRRDDRGVEAGERARRATRVPPTALSVSVCIRRALAARIAARICAEPAHDTHTVSVTSCVCVWTHETPRSAIVRSRLGPSPRCPRSLHPTPAACRRTERAPRPSPPRGRAGPGRGGSGADFCLFTVDVTRYTLFELFRRRGRRAASRYPVSKPLHRDRPCPPPPPLRARPPIPKRKRVRPAPRRCGCASRPRRPALSCRAGPRIPVDPTRDRRRRRRRALTMLLAGANTRDRDR